jgi:hypothetical protein
MKERRAPQLFAWNRRVSLRIGVAVCAASRRGDRLH